jgi:hypothetical protein
MKGQNSIKTFCLKKNTKQSQKPGFLLVTMVHMGIPSYSGGGNKMTANPAKSKKFTRPHFNQ